MKTRAERRRESDKALKRGRQIAKSWNVRDPKKVDKIAYQHRDSPTRCSCPTCCNKRRSDWTKPKDKLTLQERRVTQSERETLKD